MNHHCEISTWPESILRRGLRRKRFHTGSVSSGHWVTRTENTNGLLRQYFPRGTDFSRISQSYLNSIALRLNQRPRKTLGFETPAHKLREVLH